MNARPQRTLDDVNRVADMKDGEVIAPAKHRRYGVRDIAAQKIVVPVGDVVAFVRQGECVFAETSTGDTFRFMGNRPPYSVVEE